ncbi:hypothetical protein ES705_03972 [subsurface metagenome]
MKMYYPSIAEKFGKVISSKTSYSQNLKCKSYDERHFTLIAELNNEKNI